MHFQFTSSVPLTSLIIALGAWLSGFYTANASEVVVTKDSSATQSAFAGEVSATDLLQGLTPVTGGWNTGNQASPRELTDGIHGAAFQAVPGDAVQGAWTTVGATAEYQLGTSPGGGGFDITSVLSISDWNGAAFGNQAWKMEVKPVGGAYVTLTIVDHQPLGAGTGGTTKVTLTSPGGILASGIEAIKITANQVNSGANSGAFVWRELDVFGTPANDETPPDVATLVPASGSPDVLPSSDLVATFNESIVLGTGTITIRNLDAPADNVITLPDPRVSVSSKVLTIDPTSDLTPGHRHAILLGPGAIKDVSGNHFGGFTDETAWNFTVGQPDVTAPLILAVNPADGANAVPSAANLVATFDENIAIGTGTITIKNLETSAQIVITLPDARVTVSGAVLTINPSANLAITTRYAVRIGTGAVSDLSGNPFGGIDDDTAWNFKTATAPLRIVCMGDSITTGYTDNPGWVNHPFEFGYRSGLHTLLNNDGYNFLFVGGSTEPWTGISGDPTRGGTYKPLFDLRDIGLDGHRGYGGKAVNFLNSNILTWLSADNPDIILLKIGTNSQDQSGLDTLVGTITTTKPGCHLIIAEIMPKYSYQSGIVNYNTYIRNTLIPKYQALGKKVTLVNQYAPFLTNPVDLTTIDQSLFSNGINHPDNDGYDKMAQVWFNGIEALGIGPNTFENWISDPSFGIASGKQGFGDDPDGDGLKSGIEALFGSHPGVPSAGLSAISAEGVSLAFSHLRNENPPDGLSGSYEWSQNLVDWYQCDGAETSPAGSSVTIVTVANAATTHVTATASAPMDRWFLRFVATRN